LEKNEILCLFAANILLTVLKEIRPADDLKKAEIYCLTDYIVGLSVTVLSQNTHSYKSSLIEFSHALSYSVGQNV